MRRFKQEGREPDISRYEKGTVDKTVPFFEQVFYYPVRPYFTAIASTSQSTPFGSSLTATQLLAGFEVK